MFALGLIAFASASCASDPRVLDRQELEGFSTKPATKLLIVVSSKAVSDPRVNVEIEAYKNAMTAAVQTALRPVPAQLVDITSSNSSNPLSQTLFDFRPSHVIQISPAGSSSVNGFPVGYTWRLEVSDVSITRFAAEGGKPSGTSIKRIPAYEMKAEGDACFLTTRQAKECGASMGKLLGEALRAAPVLQIEAGT
ncbi:hypothetical protein [Caballeronia novacaledonica]|nr:hypothetical protein [Caballeronia novacaledonica]